MPRGAVEWLSIVRAREAVCGGKQDRYYQWAALDGEHVLALGTQEVEPERELAHIGLKVPAAVKCC